jgi:hypothetical protein
MTTAADIVNRALELSVNQEQVTGTLPNFDGTPAGLAAGVLYPICRDLLLREIDPEFAWIVAAPLTPVAGAPIVPWQYEYVYPADCVRARQIGPPATGAGALADPFDPQPVRGMAPFDPRAGITKRVILTDQQNALLAYTANSIIENLWDPGFSEAMSRRLSSPLAMALAGRPDFARELLAESEKYAQLAMSNEDLM